MENKVKPELLEPEMEEMANEPAEAAEEQPRRKGLMRFFVMDRYLKYVVFLVFIGLIYVWNSNIAERQVRKEQRLKHSIEEAQAEYKTVHARFSNDSRRKAVEQRVDTTLNLHPLHEPPYKLEKKVVK
jgi:Bacteriodetes cell division protein (FtsL-like)